MASTQRKREVNLAGNRDAFSKISTTQVNVSPIERWLAGLGGGTLAIYGIARRDWAGAGLALLGGALLYRGATGHSMIYQRLNSDEEHQLSANISTIPGGKGIKVHRTVTINRSAAELYNFWHDVEMTPLYTPLIESVTRTDERTSRWMAKTPTGQQVEWISEMVEDIPGSLIAWHVLGKAPLGNAGKVSFQSAPGGRGTEVTLELDYSQNPVLLSFGKLAGRAAEVQVMETLRRFKNLMEADEVPTIKGQPTGKGRK